ncbi:GAF domain-containing protein [Nocardia nova]|uniref:GAF domain-containing protein n=1 Tax=Nocardia nova TaxID=37330 RepID=UPI0004AF8C75
MDSDRNGPGWLLIETFGWPKQRPTVVNWGGRPREFVPLDKPLRNAADRVRRAVGAVAESGAALSVCAAGHRVETVPHIVDGRLHGVQAGPERNPTRYRHARSRAVGG